MAKGFQRCWPRDTHGTTQSSYVPLTAIFGQFYVTVLPRGATNFTFSENISFLEGLVVAWLYVKIVSFSFVTKVEGPLNYMTRGILREIT